MRIPLLLFCTPLGSAFVISPYNLHNSSKYIHRIEPTQGFGGPDPRFSVSIDFSGPRIPLISYLVDTVQILCQLGLEDFSGSMEATSWKLVDYPNVGVVLLPKIAGRPVQRRFVIWGLFQSAVDMIQMRRFQTASITLEWEGAEVGMILIVEWQETQKSILAPCYAAIPDRSQQSAPAVNNLANSSTCAAPTPITTDSNQDLRILGYLTGSTVDLFSVFLLVITVITGAAEKAATERIDEYISPTTIPGVLVRFLVPTSPRTSPPFFEAQWLIRCMAAIPDYMIKKGVFREGLFLIEVDGVRVADAFLEKKSPTVDSSSAVSNVSVA